MSVIYQEWQPPTEWQDRLQCLWRLRDLQADGQVQTIYPDGRCEIILHLAEPPLCWDQRQGWHRQAAQLFAAQQRSAIRLRAEGPIDCLGLRLQPAASALLAGKQLPALRDQIIDLERLAPGLAAHARTQLDHWTDPDGASPGWCGLSQWLGPAQAPARLLQALALLAQQHGQLRIDELSRTVGLPLRTLQAQFLRWVGLGAKEYARLLRLQAALRRLDANSANLSALALDSGFADQAHASRELRRLTGLPPAQLLHALRADRQGEATIAMAAAFVRGRR